jgi:hypothetical protein
MKEFAIETLGYEQKDAVEHMVARGLQLAACITLDRAV